MRPKTKPILYSLSAALVILWGSSGPLYADDSALLKYTYKPDQAKVGLLRDMKGKTYLPLMDLAQFYGVQVQFDSQTRRVSLLKGKNALKLVLSQPVFMATGPDDMSVPIEPVEVIAGQLGIPPASAEDVFATILDLQVNYLPDQQALVAGGVNLVEPRPESAAPTGPSNNSSAVPAANTAVGAPSTAAPTAVPTLEEAREPEEETSKTPADKRNTEEPPPSQTIRARRIIIDAGHGGTDAGAPGYDRRYVEKEATLDIAKRVANYLKGKDDDLEVLMTRDADYYITLKYRTDFANSHDADLFVSIHCNSNPREGAHGTEIYRYGSKASNRWAAMAAERENGWKRGNKLTMLEELKKEGYEKYNRKLAEIVEESIAERLGQHFRNIQQAPFYVLAHADMPSILVETAFISNNGEENKLRDPYWRDNMAKAIAEGILGYKKVVEGNGENQEARR